MIAKISTSFLHNSIIKNTIKILPQAYTLDWIINFLCPFLPPNTLTKLRYRFNPSTLIQKKVVNIKYWIMAATAWQPALGFTLSVPARKITSNINNDIERQSRIFDGSFLRKLLKRKHSKLSRQQFIFKYI